jgi:hypothetical protein
MEKVTGGDQRRGRHSMYEWGAIQMFSDDAYVRTLLCLFLHAVRNELTLSLSRATQ